MDYFAVVGAVPFLDYILDKNPVFKFGPPGFNAITENIAARIKDRVEGRDKTRDDQRVPDFLDQIMDLADKNIKEEDYLNIISRLMINMIAGADTTAILLSNTICFALEHPQVWEKLAEEVRAEIPERGVRSYKDICGLPYLTAVVRESSRYHPPVAMTLERYVPKSGYKLPNIDFLPPGVAVGVSPFIINHNTDVYGADANHFRPERWFQDVANGETAEQFETRLQRMTKTDMSFGAGARNCIGRPLAEMVTYMLLHMFILSFDPDLVAGGKVFNSFFMRREGMMLMLKRFEA